MKLLYAMMQSFCSLDLGRAIKHVVIKVLTLCYGESCSVLLKAQAHSRHQNY